MTRTPGQQFRKLLLYPTELRGQNLDHAWKRYPAGKVSTDAPGLKPRSLSHPLLRSDPRSLELFRSIRLIVWDAIHLMTELGELEVHAPACPALVAERSMIGDAMPWVE